MKISNRFIVIGTLLAVGLIGGATLALADGDTIRACVNNNSGTIKLVGSTGECKNNDQYIEWNIVSKDQNSIDKIIE